MRDKREAYFVKREAKKPEQDSGHIHFLDPC